MLKIYAAALAAMTLASTPVYAEFPDKPIRLVTAGAPGTGSDTLTRLLGGKMSEILKQPIIIENKPGAGGAVAMAHVALAAPDGYTIILGSFSGNVLVPASNPNINYSVTKDFVPIGQIASAPTMLVVRSDSPVKTVEELAERSRKTPGGIQYASWGYGSTGHFCGELLSHSMKANLSHIPYKSVAQITTDLQGGHVDVATVDMITGLGLVQSGRARALILCVDGSDLLPDVPSYVDKNIDFDGKKPTVARWVMYAPAGVPEPVRKKLSAALQQSINMPDINDWLKKQGNSPAFLDGAKAVQADQDDRKFWVEVAEGLGIKTK